MDDVVVTVTINQGDAVRTFTLSKSVIASIENYEGVLRSNAARAAAVRRRLIALAFNPGDEAVLKLEAIEDEALAVLDDHGASDGMPF